MQTRSRPTDLRLALGLALVLVLGGCGDDDQPHALQLGEADAWAHAVSQILIEVKEGKRTEAEARDLAYRVHARLVEGEPFATMAQRHSEHESRRVGGFLGFVPIKQETRFHGAVQALTPGQTSQPVRTGIGYQIIHRHSLEEGIALEKKYLYPIYGFFIRYQGMPQGRVPKPAAEELASRVYAELKTGMTTLEEARAKYASLGPRPRPDAFLLLTDDRPERAGIVDPVKKVEPGEFVPPFDTPDGFAVLKRGKVLRCVLREIVVMHVEALERPLSVKRSPREAYALAQRCLAEVAPDKSNWSALVQKYTDDDVKERPDGTMGLIGNGDVPFQVEAALMETPPGEVHPEVVQSAFGFHILWRVR